MQRVEKLAAHLDAVFQAVQRRLDQVHVRLIGTAVLNVAAAQLGRAQQGGRQGDVALEFELCRRLESEGASGMSGDEHELARARPREINFQMVRRPCRLAVLIRAQNGEVERPARKLEVIGIAAERRDIGFRREHEPHVVVALVLI